MTPPAHAATAAARRGSAQRAPARRSPAPHVPRRKSGPVRPSVRTAPRPAARNAPSPRRAARVATATIDHRLIDRLVRGRGWIPVIAILLLGLVVMQVSLLRLNSGISRAVETTATLERQNDELRASIARLASSERIQTAASHLGMLLPASDQLIFRNVREDDARRASAALRERPSPQTAIASAAATQPAAMAGVVTGTQPGATATTTTPAAPVADTGATTAAAAGG